MAPLNETAEAGTQLPRLATFCQPPASWLTIPCEPGSPWSPYVVPMNDTRTQFVSAPWRSGDHAPEAGSRRYEPPLPATEPLVPTSRSVPSLAKLAGTSGSVASVKTLPVGSIRSITFVGTIAAKRLVELGATPRAEIVPAPGARTCVHE